MRLGDRLKQNDGPTTGSSAPRPKPKDVDPLHPLKLRVQEALYARLGNRLADPALGPDELRNMAIAELTEVLEAEQIPLSKAERDSLLHDISDDVLGYGPLEHFLADPTITEIMANAEEGIYIERDGKLELTTAKFASDEHLRRVIERIVSQVGRRIDESSPMVDARLPDGSRVNAIIPPLAVDGPALTIRKFSQDAYSTEDLIKFGTFTSQAAEFLEACVIGKLNILVSGGTGTGKTTLLNVLSSYIPVQERIVTIEDAVELRLHQRHVIRLESRPSNIEGRGEITIRELVRNSLRMRPDRIIVGEVRGGEALDMLQAMNTGHDGSLSTLHANTTRDALSRLETMVLMAGLDLPVRAIREQAASAIDLLVHLTRTRDGGRKVARISEIVGMENDTIMMNDIFLLEHEDEDISPTGLRPSCIDKLEYHGLSVPADLFSAPIATASRRRGSRAAAISHTIETRRVHPQQEA